MKRKLTFCTFVLTALLLAGCTRQNTPGAENSSATESAVQPSPSDATHSAEPSPSDVAPSAEPSPSQSTQNEDAPGQKISEEEARKISIDHAGLSADQVTVIKSGIDTDNGKKYYDVEFFDASQKEYDYEIDLYTGEILDYDHDAEYFPQSSEIAESDRIQEDEAKQIALAKVPGATEQNIRKFHSDYDNGKHHYEGKIYYDHTEYEFEIDGSTGEILEWDVEPIY